MGEGSPDQRLEAQRKLSEVAEQITPGMLLSHYKIALAAAIKRGELKGKDQLIVSLCMLEEVFKAPTKFPACLHLIRWTLGGQKQKPFRSKTA